MHRVEVKLAAWHRLFKEFEDARLRLTKAAIASTAGSEALAALEAEVLRLQRAKDQAFDLVQTELTSSSPAFAGPARRNGGGISGSRSSLRADQANHGAPGPL